MTWIFSAGVAAAVTPEVAAAGVEGVLVHPAMNTVTNRTAIINAIDPIYTLFLIV